MYVFLLLFTWGWETILYH